MTIDPPKVERIVVIASGSTFGYDPTVRYVYHIKHIKIDHYTFSLFKKLTPKFIFVNDFIPKAYKETEKYFALFARN